MAPLFEKKKPLEKNTYSFYLPEDLIKEIDKISKMYKISRSEVLEKLAWEGIQQHSKGQKKNS